MSARRLSFVAMPVLGSLAASSLPRAPTASRPAGKEVAEVLVSGNQVRLTHEILAVFGPAPGQQYIEENIRTGTDELYDKGWFTPNGIELRTVERPDGKVNVILYVTELTNFIEEIKYIGAEHLSKTELEQAYRLAHPHADVAAPESASSTRTSCRKYQEDGRIHASVTLREGTKLDDRRVVFDIVEGPKVKITAWTSSSSASTSPGSSSGRLREQLTISRAKLGGLIGGEYNPARSTATSWT